MAEYQTLSYIMYKEKEYQKRMEDERKKREEEERKKQEEAARKADEEKANNRKPSNIRELIAMERERARKGKSTENKSSAPPSNSIPSLNIDINALEELFEEEM